MKCCQFRSLLLPALAGLAALGHARQPTFYTVDVISDRLKTVSLTGAIKDIGPLGFDAKDIDLAMHQGTLYGLDGQGFYSINTNTGAATMIGPLLQIMLGLGYRSGGALASDGTDLYCSYGPVGSDVTPLWGRFLSPTMSLVTLVGVVDDVDGAAYAGGQFWGLNAFKVGTNVHYLYSGYPSPTSYALYFPSDVLWGTWDDNDIEVIGTQCYSITSRFLIERTTTSAAFVDFRDWYSVSLRGLAKAPGPGDI